MVIPMVPLETSTGFVLALISEVDAVGRAEVGAVSACVGRIRAMEATRESRWDPGSLVGSSAINLSIVTIRATLMVVLRWTLMLVMVPMLSVSWALVLPMLWV